MGANWVGCGQAHVIVDIRCREGGSVQREDFSFLMGFRESFIDAGASGGLEARNY